MKLAIALFVYPQAILLFSMIGILGNAGYDKSYTIHRYCRNYRIALHGHLTPMFYNCIWR